MEYEDLKSKLVGCKVRIRELEKIIQLIQQWTKSAFGEDIPYDIINYKLDEELDENNDEHLGISELLQNIEVKIEPEDDFDEPNGELLESDPDSTPRSKRNLNEKRLEANKKFRLSNLQHQQPSTSGLGITETFDFESSTIGQLLNENNNTCGECGLENESKSQLMKHLSLTNHKRYKCQICSELYTSLQEINSHLKSHPTVSGLKSGSKSKHFKSNLKSATKPKFTCGQCGLVLRSEIRLRHHLTKSCNKTFRFSCEVCYRLYETELQLNLHKEIVHINLASNSSRPPQKVKSKAARKSYKSVENYLCGECGLEWPEEEVLLRHLELSGHKRFSCHLCPYLTYKKDHMDRHKDIHITETNFNCPHCPLKFKSAFYRDKHLARQSCKILQCPVENCDIKFSKKEKLQAHLKLHNLDLGQEVDGELEKPSYPCQYCPKSYRAQGLLRHHILLKHKNVIKWSYTCGFEGCDKVFNIKSRYENHLRMHTEMPEKFVPEPSKKICEICGVSVNRAYLQNHIKIVHEKKKNCQCTFPGCGKMYFTQTRMKQCFMKHKMSSEERKAIQLKNRLPCEQCGKLFTSKATLNGHISAVHDKLKPFICTVGDCTWSFAVKTQLLEHYSVHINPSRPEFNEEFSKNPPEGLQEFLQKRKISRDKYMKKVKDRSGSAQEYQMDVDSFS